MSTQHSEVRRAWAVEDGDSSFEPARLSDFAAPTGQGPRLLELAGPGVIHPAHFGHVAKCLGWSNARLEQVCRAPNDDETLDTVVKRLAQSTGAPVDELATGGLRPSDLVLRRLKVRPASQRPNLVDAYGHQVLSAENAAWLEVLKIRDRFLEMTEAGLPSILLDSQAAALQRAFEDLVARQEHAAPAFFASGLEARALVQLPAEAAAGPIEDPLRPCDVALVNTTALIRFPAALVQVDLASGEFSVRPFSGAAVAFVGSQHVVFCDGAQLSLFNLERGAFTDDATALPITRLILGACCGVEVLDVPTGHTALLPGIEGSQPYGFASSPCGRFGWLDCTPAHDSIGVFSIERVERVMRVWPHEQLGMPAGQGEGVDEGYDSTARALVVTGAGVFRLAYGSEVLHERLVHQLPVSPVAVAFDPTGTALAAVDQQALSIFALEPNGAPALRQQWSLAELYPHLSFEALTQAETGLDAATLAGAVSTTERLAAMSVAQLTERLFFESDVSAPALAGLIERARSVKRATRLQPIS